MPRLEIQLSEERGKDFALRKIYQLGDPKLALLHRSDMLKGLRHALFASGIPPHVPQPEPTPPRDPEPEPGSAPDVFPPLNPDPTPDVFPPTSPEPEPMPV